VPVLRWGEFALEAPQIAGPAEDLLRAFTLAFVATIRPDGWPRVHPLTVTLHDGGLYVFVVPSTPKLADLERDDRYALHSFPRFREGTLATYVDDEFTCSGRAVRIDDRELRAAVVAVHNDSVTPRHPLLRLDLDRAHHRTRVDGKAVYGRWSAARR
jgi:pyridoxamine 5'-phosphate oxidase-like protein